MNEFNDGPRTVFHLLRAAQLPARALTAGFDAPVTGLAVDSRKLIAGDCFVALRGSACDGHAYVERALAAGAGAVIVEARHYQGNDPRAVVVPDTHLAVARLAASFYELDRLQRDGKLTLVGVTGTNGKTTVMTLVQAVLAAAGWQVASLGTIANDLGGGDVPHAVEASSMTTLPPIELCQRLARAVREGATHAVLEVSSHALDQKRTDGLQFAAAVFTNLSHDHLDYHGEFAAYRSAKKRLFDGLSADAIAVVNADDASSPAMLADCAARVRHYCAADARIQALSLDGTEFLVEGDAFAVNGAPLEIRSRLVGRHNVANLLAAAMTGAALGVPPSTIAKGLERVRRVPGRMEAVTGDSAERLPRVYVDYAHTPDALEKVLAVMREAHDGRIHCVFGCGGDRDRDKRSAMGAVVAAHADEVWVTSDNPRTENPQRIMEEIATGLDAPRTAGWHMEADRKRAIAGAIAAAGPGDLVLIAGKGHEDYQIVGTQRLWFDDRVVAAEALASRGRAA